MGLRRELRRACGVTRRAGEKWVNRMPWWHPGPVAPRLVPELICSDIARSRAFYCGVLGFDARYARPHEGFLYVERDGAALMLEQPLDQGRLFPRAELAHPYGRGVNFEIDVDDVGAVLAAVEAAGHPLFLPLEDRWYEREKDSVRVRQFAVQDPDGYLLRFSQTVAARPR